MFVKCQECGKRLMAPDRLRGQTVTCPACSAAIIIPLSSGDSDAEAGHHAGARRSEKSSAFPGKLVVGFVLLAGLIFIHACSKRELPLQQEAERRAAAEKDAKAKEIEAILEELEKKADALIAKERLLAAVLVYQEYTGKYADETRAERHKRAALINWRAGATVRRVPISYALDSPGKVVLVINDKSGKRVRNLIARADRAAGRQAETWDGRDNEGKIVPNGEYDVKGALTPGLSCIYEFTVYNPGDPPFWTVDNGDPRRNPGGWASDHYPPRDIAAAGDVIFIGSEAAESGHAIFAVNEDGKKLWGARWINLAGAKCLASDGNFAYMGAEGHWIGKNTRIYQISPKSFRTRVIAQFSHEDEGGGLSALAAHTGLVYAAFNGENKRIAVYNSDEGKKVHEFPAPAISGMVVSPFGVLLAVSGKKVFRVLTDTGKFVPVITENLLEPHSISTDGSFLYVSDVGDHTIKKFRGNGELVGTIGIPGGLKAGPYDPRHMSNPYGIDFDSQGRLWVAEHERQPKKISVWSVAGPKPKLVTYYAGSGQYGCGHTYIDPRKPSRFFYDGMEFEVDWETGNDRIKSILSRGVKYTRPIYYKDRLYLVSEKHRFYGGQWGIARYKDGRVVPAARLGPVGQLSETIRGQLGNPNPKKTRYVWSDRNADGEMQADEIETAPTLRMHSPWVTRIGGDLAIQQHDECLAPVEVTSQGVPIYSFKNTRPTPKALGTSPWEGQTYWNMELTRDDKIIEVSPVIAVKSRSGEPLWTYPEGNNRCIGVHANKNSPPYAEDVLAGTLGVLGQATLPNLGDFFALHSNRGEVNFFTIDGLFIGRVFRDNRLGTGGFNFPKAERGMKVEHRSLQQEHFGGTLSQVDDGRVYLIVGHNHSSVVRVDGLDKIKRFKTTVTVSPDAFKAVASLDRGGGVEARAGQVDAKRATTPPRIDADLAEWKTSQFIALKGSGDHKGRAALKHDSSNLYAAFEVRSRPDLVNNGSDMKLLFRSGDSVDIQLGSTGHRVVPMQGDLRLTITKSNGKPAAILYRYVVPGTLAGDKVVYKSPVAETIVDSVTLLENVEIAIKRLPDNGYAVEAAIPWSALNMKAPRGRMLGDLGILFANNSGSGISERVHWSNDQTGLVSDVPGEIMLSPNLWGPVIFK